MNRDRPMRWADRVLRRQFLAAAALATLVVLVGCGTSMHVADPAAGAARWFKGNTHVHSRWSDGRDFPEMVADWYGAGYAINGRDDLAEWFGKNLGKMALHRNTRLFVSDLIAKHAAAI